MFRFCRLAVLLPLLACLAGGAFAQAAFPGKPLTLIVNGGAGSLPDLFARPLADKLRQSLGQAVVVDNRPGAGGMVAMQALKGAPADGHTLALVTNAHAVWNPYVFPRLSYDPVADLLPVSPVAVIPMALAVNARLPAASLDELVALAKTQPGTLNYASSGNGSPPHVLFDLLKSQSATDIVHVPFKTGPDALTSVAAGDTQIYLAATSLLEPLVKDGRLRVLAVSPQVAGATWQRAPTLASRGYPGFESAVWLGVVTNAGVPAEVVVRLNREIGAALQDPALQASIASHGSIVWHASPAAFAERIAADRRLWTPVLQKLNLTPELNMQLIDSIVTEAAALQAVRRDIHAHPELAFEETRTAGVVAELLTRWGIPLHRGLAKTGIVGVIQSGTSDRAIGLRADMDALPMAEHNSFAHASRHAGKMHACGHDGHTTMLLGAAQQLARMRDAGAFDGTVYLIFQPAEEHGGGAREMMRGGLFERFPMQAVFGMHNMPGIPVGQFAASPGPVLASNNEFKITIRGKGGHAAMPHLAVDPIPVAGQMMAAFQTIISRNKKPLETAVISVTMIHAGDVANVIPDTCEMQGTVRAYTAETLDLIERRMREIAEHTGAVFGAQVDFHFQRNYPSTINHAAESAFVREVLADIVGPQQVITQTPIMAAEDFAFMLEQVPGCYAFIGNGDGDHRLAGHGGGPCVVHNPSYDFNDELLPLGATFFCRLVERWFSAQRG